MRLALCFVVLAPLWAQGTLPDYQRFLTYSEKQRPLTAGIAGDIRWIENSDRFWYSRTTATGNEFVIANVSGTKQPAFDHQRLANALTALKSQPFDPNRLTLTNLQFKANTVEFQLATERLELDLKTYEIKVIPQTGPIWSGGPRVLESPRPIRSPDGKSEIFIQNYNVWLRSKPNNPLTTDGSEGNYYTLSAQA